MLGDGYQMTEREMLEMLLTDMKELKTQVKSSASDITELKAQVQKSASDITELKAQVQKNAVGLESLKVRTEQNSVGLAELKAQVQQNTLVVENTINHCIKVLGEGYQMTSEKVDRLNIDSLQSKINQITLTTALVNDKVDLLKKEMNKTA